MKRTATFLTQLGLALTLTSTVVACGGSEPTPLPPEDPGPPADTVATAPTDPAPTASVSAAEPAPLPPPTVAATATAAPSASAPAAPKDPPAASTGLDVPGANLSIGSISADGFEMKDIACKSEDAGGLGGLVLGPALAGVLSKKKAQLRACSPKGGEARVRFVMDAGKVLSAEAKAETPQIEACVIKVVKSVQAPLGGTCAATLDLSR